jgi:4-hydroxy-3-methylbut-2-en-1-yl diphosphate reductase
MTDNYYRSGFGLKGEIHGTLVSDYHSALVDEVRSRGYALTAGGLTVHLAREFGFCYGVDRAVEYAYEARAKFPGKRIFLVGEIIHNPHVNARLASMGIVIIRRSDAGEFDFSAVAPEDVVIMPAFGVTK